MSSGPRQKWERFRENRWALIGAVYLSSALLLALLAPLLCNYRPLILYWDGALYSPALSPPDATIFGETIATEPDYRTLVRTRDSRTHRRWALFPVIPYGPNESHRLSTPPPSPPSRAHWLGTDDRGRDLAARLLYGLRSTLLFSGLAWLLIALLATTVGCLQGYSGGWIDFVIQRLTEIFNALPILYVIIFLLSLLQPSLIALAAVWGLFNWVGLAGYTRAEALRVRQLDYIAAAKSEGLSTPRILLRHVLPNSLLPLLTFTPFIIGAAITSLAALDYLGLGLPPPTATWGELLRQGKENLSAWWLSLFPFLSLSTTLLALNFIGEGLRSAIDPADRMTRVRTKIKKGNAPTGSIEQMLSD
ncbi:MAG: ABC transporter permease subunit [Deltaproteobacteria bacterium]|nr:ABC transporter permease subunit [Deltaproteobacteria bacterium]MBI3295640.1 ABC transporter permease subunit [Deltaproteobacteria bacterium]